MKRLYHLCALLLIVGLLFSVAKPIQKANAQAIPCPLGICFGGYVTLIVPCNTGLLVYVYGIPFMWMYGTPIVGIPPNHIGQGILGAAVGFAPCFFGIVPLGGGLIMLPLPFTGTSVI